MTVLTNWVLKRKAATVLIVLLITLLGVFAVTQLKSEQLPNVDFPYLTVSTVYPGATSNDVTNQVSIPVEQAVAQLPGIKTVRSTSLESFSLVFAEFNYGSNMRDLQQQLDTKLRTVTLPNGPTGAPLQPQSSNFSISSQALLLLSVKGKNGQSSEQIGKWARDIAKPGFATVKDVGSIEITGDAVQQVTITFDPVKLAQRNLTINDVVNTLKANNLSFPAGSAVVEGQNLPIRTAYTFAKPEDLGELVVTPSQGAAGGQGAGGSAPAGGQTAPAGAPSDNAAQTAPAGQAAPQFTKLKDVATVKPEVSQASGISRVDGQPGIILQVFKTQTGNTVVASDGTIKKIDEINKAYPDYEVGLIYDQGVAVRSSIDGLTKEGLLGALFAVLVIFVFIRSIRSTLVTAISIPTSVVVAFILMWTQGITLNIFSLGGLAIAIGRVVDDAIVVLENIYRHVSEGEDVQSAVRSGTKEVAGAITGSTLTTVAVFLPLGFVGGITGQFFLPFALTVTFAILASLVVALTVIPLFASLFITRKSVKPEHKDTWTQKLYLPALKWSLGHRVVTLLVAFFLLIGSFALAIGVGIPVAFLGESGDKLLSVSVTMQPGTAQDVTLKKAEEVEAILKNDSEVRLYQTTIAGNTAFSRQQRAFGGSVGDATIFVRLDPAAKTNDVIKRLRPQFDKIRPQGGNVAVQSLGGFSSNSLSLIVQGPNPEAVRQASDLVVKTIQDEKIADLTNVKSDLSAKTNQILISPDPTKSPFGNTALIGSQLRSLLQGQSGGTITFGDGRSLEILLQVPPPNGNNIDGYIENLKQLTVLRQGTQEIKLGQVAEVKRVEEANQTTRINQLLAATVTADITSEDVAGITNKVTTKLKTLTLPAGTTYTLSGVAQQQGEAFGGLFIAMGAAIALVYIVMVILFGSLLEPFAILFSLPLAIIGALVALVITQRALGLSAMIGLLMLIGIVVTNAIVLIDLVNQLRKQGHNKTEALLMAGRNRVRPIVMTAIATILALIPLALGLSEGSIIAAELGTVVIGGLFSSTLLTLLVVPCIYSLLEGLKDRLTGQHKGDKGDKVSDDKASDKPAEEREPEPVAIIKTLPQEGTASA